MGGADAQGVLAQSRVRSDVERGGCTLFLFLIHCEIGEREAGLVGDEFLECGDVVVVQSDFNGSSPLPARGGEGGEGVGKPSREQEGRDEKPALGGAAESDLRGFRHLGRDLNGRPRRVTLWWQGWRQGPRRRRRFPSAGRPET